MLGQDAAQEERWLFLDLKHQGLSQEGSSCHPRQHCAGYGCRFGKFAANHHHVCSLLGPSFCELIVNVMEHIDAEARAAGIWDLAPIPA